MLHIPIISMSSQENHKLMTQLFQCKQEVWNLTHVMIWIGIDGFAKELHMYVLAR